MINTSAAYKEAIVGDARRTLIKAVVDIVGPDIVYGKAVSSGESAYSRSEQLHDKVFRLGTPYPTLERNRWILDGSFPDDPDEDNQVGYESDAIFDENGEGNIFVELPFSGVRILQACSVYFPDAFYDGYPVDFTVEVKQGGTAYYTQSFMGNTERSVSLEGFTVYNPDAIRVTATRWSLPSRRMRIPEIVPGIYEEWSNRDLSALSISQQGDFSALSLPYGTAALSMNNVDKRFDPRSKNGLFRSIEERQAIDISLGVRTKDGDEYTRSGLYYQYNGGWKTSDNDMSIAWSLVDIIGLLADRQFIPPETLPATLEGWIRAIVSQLGQNFETRYIVDPDYAELPVAVREYNDVVGKKCGDILLWACQATGTWPRADAETGKLAVEPLWSQGNTVTIDNLSQYPVIKANNDVAAIVFTLNDGENTQFALGGSNTSSSETRSVNNPFIKTEEEAFPAARAIFSAIGGNQYELTGRGNPSSEIGDVDTIAYGDSTAVTGRRMQQTFEFSNGVMQGCKSVLLQADGSFLYQNRVVITESGTWTAPPGVTSLRFILVSKGGDGADGKDGTFSAAGANGADGLGGKILAQTVNINDQQTFDVSIDEYTVFGPYSSADGEVYPYGYSDIASGKSFGRTGVSSPLPGSGDGGKGGAGGAQGRGHSPTGWMSDWITDVPPGRGAKGAKGATGCVIIYYDKGDGA